MNIERQYNQFVIGARMLNLKNATEVRTIIESQVKITRFVFWLAFPACLLGGLLFLPLFGMGIIFFIFAAVLWFTLGKKPRIMKAVGERYIQEMGYGAVANS